MAKFITLCGKKQVGKDTSAHMIHSLLVPPKEIDYDDAISANSYTELEPHPIDVYIVSFAGTLKRACSIIFGIPLQDMETEEGKQKLTDVIYPIGKTEYGRINDRIVGYQPFLGVTDLGKRMLPERRMTVRKVLQFVGTNLFRNQLDPDIWVKAIYRRKYRDDDVVIIADCRFVNEARFGKKHGLLIKIERDTGLAADDHDSETALDEYTDYDYVIDNNSSLDALKDKLSVVLREEGFTL
jgi:hypothetical protein